MDPESAVEDWFFEGTIRRSRKYAITSRKSYRMDTPRWICGRPAFRRFIKWRTLMFRCRARSCSVSQRPVRWGELPFIPVAAVST